jgi:hypothetical protein
MYQNSRPFFQMALASMVLVGAILACVINYVPKSYVPDASGTQHAPLIPLAGFLDSDCPTQGLSGLTTNASPGALDCTYHWNGNFGANNAEIRIMQYPAAPLFQQVLSSDLKNLQTQVATIKSDQSRGTGRKNDNLDIIQADSIDYIYMETYTGPATIGSTAVPLCGDGWGAMGVHGQFEVYMYLRESCDISTNASDYSNLIRSMQAAVVKAVTRAVKSMQP